MSEEPNDPQAASLINQSTTAAALILQAMGKRQISGALVEKDGKNRQGRDVDLSSSSPDESAASTPEAGEPEVKRRKPARPHKVKRSTSGRRVDPSVSPVKSKTTSGGVDTETSAATFPPPDTKLSSSAVTKKEKELSSSNSGNGSTMIVHAVNHEFEVEVDVEATLRTVIRLLQPSLNYDLSQAAITLRGEHELNMDTRLRSFVRDGSQGMVKVKVVVVCHPTEKLQLTIMDVLKAETVAGSKRPLAPPVAQTSDLKVSAKKRSLNPKKLAIAGQHDDSDWVTSESFVLLRSSLGLPLDPAKWDGSHVSHWLAWATKSFSLPDLDVIVFSRMNGAQLTTMSRDMFTALVGKDRDDLFWRHFQILRNTKRAAVPAKRITPEYIPSPSTPKVASKRASRTTGIRRPLTMSDGWKNREDLFASVNAGTIQLWQFLLETLAAGRERDSIEWTGEPGEFVLIEPERVAELWGRRKNKDNMNYEKMSRALRYYYGGDVLAKVPGKHYTYKFICDLAAVGYTGPTVPQSSSFSGSVGAGVSHAGSSSPPGTFHSSQPSSPSSSHHGSAGDSDGSIDLSMRNHKASAAGRVGSLTNALESIRRHNERSASQVAA
ncbi:putative GA-binding protein alpha chain [Hypsibius exemplaris]|uniref:GA-binding protein alpha chain n=1 Tax=Hypsibius exemplaris TaxID=2072580 RepID=A0A1W0XEJ3_HYPEX|nr:putative GA-binding protein alpha chain [Hypsibius exemplaris]